MRFFTHEELLHAVEAMLEHVNLRDKHMLGKMSGIKRRARARAVIRFAMTLEPAPPDASITSMRIVLRALFNGKAVSNNDLHRHFATTGCKADDRVDMDAVHAWLDQHRASLQSRAEILMADLNAEWSIFTAKAAWDAGRRRRAEDQST